MTTPDPNQQPPIILTSEIIAGRTVTVRLPAEAVGRWGVTKLVRDPETGALRPVLRTWNAMVRLTEDLPRRLGIDVDASTLRVLCYAGFVRWTRMSPFVSLIDVHSLIEHLERTEGENAAEFWTAKNRARYRRAYYAANGRPTQPPAENPRQGVFRLFRD